jgi:phenylpropionate dioxygenase-like ring-hydroxylating dioxygenase large terminal subunit
VLSIEDNDTLCRVGKGTPMGELMRQYWIPALCSDELPAPDCPPLRLRLLGENLIAFRVTTGGVGVIQNACPHRGASMFFGRNEEDGLRCVYHGWKFDVSGACVDMPSEPAESNFKNKVRALAYPCEERGGIIWAYMGPRQVPPPLPEFEVNLLPEEQCSIGKTLRYCNWFQALEGDIDTVHAGFLHYGLADAERLPQGTFDYYALRYQDPKYVIETTEFGTSYGAYRPAEPGSYYWRIAHFLFPFYTMIPTGYLGEEVRFAAWVPVDDEHVMSWRVSSRRPMRQGAGAPSRSGIVGAVSRTGYLPDTTDWLGRFRLVARRENDYLIDREEQRSGSFTGIRGIFTQDQAVTESMGPIYRREQEHLGTSDAMVIRTRRRVIAAARAFANEGVSLPGVDNPSMYRRRSGGIIFPVDVDAMEVTRNREQLGILTPEHLAAIQREA